MPGGNNLWTSLSTDNSKKINAGISYSIFDGDEGNAKFRNLNFRLTWAPMNALNISMTPFYSSEKTMLQYVETCTMQGNDRFVFASLDQETFGLQFRLNVGITPDLTIQYYGQPFISAGSYDEYKMITDPKAGEFTDRFIPLQ